MPTYDYQCTVCNHRFEEFQSITAPPVETCPKCNGVVRRLISSGNGLIFKGSGFYITDYKKSNASPNKSNAGKAEKKSDSKSDTSSGSSSD